MIMVSIGAVLILGSGIAFGQYVAPPREYTQEVAAAQRSLEEALMHLQRLREPHFPEIDRAYAHIILAHTELGAPPGHGLPRGLQ
jgi:hypothetical protein